MNSFMKFFSLKISSIFVYVGFISCTSSNYVNVLQRADHLSETPEWASLTNSVASDKEKTYFLGYIELLADSSKSAALNMSDQKAYSAPMESMVNEFFQQNKIAESLRKDIAIGELIMSSLRSSRPAMPGLRITKRYWEIIEVKSAQGYNQQLHVFSLAEIPTQEYEQAKRDVISKLNNDSELSKSLNDIAKRQQDKVLPATK